MQVFGLPRHVTRAAQSASRLLEAKPPQSEAERRRDAVARWLGARTDGLGAAQAARAVGTPLSTLYRWQADAEPKSRRPHRVRKPARTPALAKAVEDRMTELARAMPAGMKWSIPFNTAPFVTISIEKVLHTLAEAMVLVFLVMFLFLQDVLDAVSVVFRCVVGPALRVQYVWS